MDVRHYFNDFLEQYGGHIGYSIRPSERRKGYATAMLRESLKYCREIGLIKILVTCLKDNEVSRKIILSCGGIYERTAVDPKTANHYERYWITLYSKNETFTGTVTKNIIG